VSSRLGLLVNPVAGMGGPVALHGTDTAPLQDEAVRRGARAVAAPRAERVLRRIPSSGIELLVPPGSMGAESARRSGWTARQLELALGERTTAQDSRRAVEMMTAAGVDLVLFAGGDGTALDVASATAGRVPVLGIPSGVKMRSGVFAASPEAAAAAVTDFLAQPDRQVSEAELLDISGDGAGELLLGVTTVPKLRGNQLVGAKSRATGSDEALLDELCRAVAEELLADTLYLFGPGSTTGRVLRELGLEGSSLGVDAVFDRVLVGRDLGEEEILRLVAGTSRARLVLGVIGGQGFLLGRGNQQLGPRLISRLRASDIVALADPDKLARLNPALLRVDIGSAHPSPWPSQYQRVRTGPRRYMVMAVSGPR